MRFERPHHAWICSGSRPASERKADDSRKISEASVCFTCRPVSLFSRSLGAGFSSVTCFCFFSDLVSRFTVFRRALESWDQESNAAPSRALKKAMPSNSASSSNDKRTSQSSGSSVSPEVALLMEDERLAHLEVQLFFLLRSLLKVCSPSQRLWRLFLLKSCKPAILFLGPILVHSSNLFRAFFPFIISTSGGLEDAKRAVHEAVIWPLKRPDLFTVRFFTLVWYVSNFLIFLEGTACCSQGVVALWTSRLCFFFFFLLKTEFSGQEPAKRCNYSSSFFFVNL